MFIELEDHEVRALEDLYCSTTIIYKACKLARSQDQTWWKEKIAFAEGNAIQYKISGNWFEIQFTSFGLPAWDKFDFRLRPSPKPDVVRDIAIGSEYFEPNIRAIFDGDTGLLKSVEMIKNEN